MLDSVEWFFSEKLKLIVYIGTPEAGNLRRQNPYYSLQWTNTCPDFFSSWATVAQAVSVHDLASYTNKTKGLNLSAHCLRGSEKSIQEISDAHYKFQSHFAGVQVCVHHISG